MCDEKIKYTNGQEVDRQFVLNEMAIQLQWWLDFNEKDYLDTFEKQPPDDTHVLPPGWPTREMLQNWIIALKG